MVTVDVSQNPPFVMEEMIVEIVLMKIIVVSLFPLSNQLYDLSRINLQVNNHNIPNQNQNPVIHNIPDRNTVNHNILITEVVNHNIPNNHVLAPK